MAGVKVAAVQAAYILMNQEACVDKAVSLLHQAAAEGRRHGGVPRGVHSR